VGRRGSERVERCQRRGVAGTTAGTKCGKSREVGRMGNPAGTTKNFHVRDPVCCKVAEPGQPKRATAKACQDPSIKLRISGQRSRPAHAGHIDSILKSSQSPPTLQSF